MINLKKVFSYEFLVVKSKAGIRTSRWYLPVRRINTGYAYECWLFPLAPFVLVFFILTKALYCIWDDLVDYSADLDLWHNRKNQR